VVTKLKVIRLSKRMTQTEAAKKAGLSQSWYSLIESGRLQPNDEQKKRLTKAFGCPAEELLSPVILENMAM
jgi:transcriptional regulator with XRE-family HTH domain